jgi:phenylpyruvate tautomerase PptA (4-oxalocrotonate tautomerase family)
VKDDTMPLYEITTARGRLTPPVKAEIAQHVTNIHCRLTGAPDEFVNVVFRDYDDCFVASTPEDRSFVMGRIRHGRSLAMRQTILRELADMWVRITGQTEAELLVALSEVDPAMVVEAGRFMPEPGREDEWFSERPARHLAVHDGPEQPVTSSRPEAS